MTGSTVYIPEGVKGVRPETPVGDELEQRLAPVIRSLEAQTIAGHHPVALRLAKGIRVVRRCEVALLRLGTGETDEQLRKAQHVVQEARKMLTRTDLERAMMGMRWE